MITLVVDGIIIRDNSVLMIERKNYPFGLALPGGKVDSNETIESAIARELNEEINADLIDAKQFRVYSSPERDPRGHYVSCVFDCKVAGDLTAMSDAKEIKYIPLDKLSDYQNKICFDHYLVLTDYLAKAKSFSLP